MNSQNNNMIQEQIEQIISERLDYVLLTIR